MAFCKIGRINLKIFAIAAVIFLIILWRLNSNVFMCLDEDYVEIIELKEKWADQHSRILVLENILNRDLAEGQNIFFLESSHSLLNDEVSLNNRQACSVESAARKNPNAQISVIFITNATLIYTEIIQVLEKYSNVAFYRMDLLEFSEGSPSEAWIKKTLLNTTSYSMSTVSDIIRLQLLWR